MNRCDGQARDACTYLTVRPGSNCDLPGEKGNGGKTKKRSNAFESRLNAFAFFSYSLFIRKVTYAGQIRQLRNRALA